MFVSKINLIQKIGSKEVLFKEFCLKTFCVVNNFEFQKNWGPKKVLGLKFKIQRIQKKLGSKIIWAQRNSGLKKLGR